MKVKTISRNPEVYERAKDTEDHRIFRNYDPEVHPFERAREYSRALTAVKMDKMFAKPFVRALAGHMEGVFCMAKHATRLSCVVSGACDGEIRIWNMASGSCNASIKAAHQGFVRGVTVVPSGEAFLSCGADGLAHLWPLQFDVYDGFDIDARPYESIKHKPLQTFQGDEAFYSIDHQFGSDMFATASSTVQLWDVHRSQPLASMGWGVEAQHSVRWNSAERSVLASAASDRSITLHDARAKTAIKKVTLPGRTNQICWNPRRPFTFTCANEDHNLYTFDMRYLDKANGVHHDFLSSVMTVDYSPTGREFVAGGYDMTVRIFDPRQSTSREVYHTRRMNRVFCTLYSSDANYVLSGSDDSNIRVWKSEASKSVALHNPRIRAQAEYRDKLKTKYGHLPAIRRIARHRHVPLNIYNARNKKSTMLAASRLKAQRIKLHRKPGTILDSDRHPKERAVEGVED